MDHGCEVGGAPRRAKPPTSHHAVPYPLERPGRGSSALPLTGCTCRVPSEHVDPVGRGRAARVPPRHVPISGTPKKKFPREATSLAQRSASTSFAREGSAEKVRITPSYPARLPIPKSSWTFSASATSAMASPRAASATAAASRTVSPTHHYMTLRLTAVWTSGGAGRGIERESRMNPLV